MLALPDCGAADQIIISQQLLAAPDVSRAATRAVFDLPQN